MGLLFELLVREVLLELDWVGADVEKEGAE
jgi:hypothetical protein